MLLRLQMYVLQNSPRNRILCYLIVNKRMIKPFCNSLLVYFWMQRYMFSVFSWQVWNHVLFRSLLFMWRNSSVFNPNQPSTLLVLTNNTIGAYQQHIVCLPTTHRWKMRWREGMVAVLMYSKILMTNLYRRKRLVWHQE